MTTLQKIIHAQVTKGQISITEKTGGESFLSTSKEGGSEEFAKPRPVGPGWSRKQGNQVDKTAVPLSPRHRQTSLSMQDWVGQGS